MLLTEKQAAREIQADKRTIRRLIETGRLRAVDIGGGRRRHYRIRPDDLHQVLPAPCAHPDASMPRAAARRRRVSQFLGASLEAFLPSV